MRVTMRTMYRQIMTNLNGLTYDLNSINNRISSGREMSRLSDDPVSLVGALGFRTSVQEIGQFQENLRFGNDVIAASESALMSTKELIISAKTLALQAINASQTTETRLNAAYEAQNFFEQAIVLGNTQVNGKYIFGGYRTIGYTEVEPTPFVKDLMDGYFLGGNAQAPQTTALTGTVTNAAIAAGDLAVNGNVTGAINTAAAVNGLNMTKAANAKAAIEAADPTVSVDLTTLNAGGVVTADPVDLTNTEVFMYLNDVPLTVTVADGANAATVAATTALAINSISDRTGVRAVVGDGTNGGVLNSVVFSNLRPGDESTIEVSGYQVITAGGAALGFGNFSQAADATHNTGEISISSAQTVALTSPNNPADDSILTALGLGGGAVGFADDAADGVLIYGGRVVAGDLLVNGRAAIAAVADGISDVMADSSAAALAAVINTDSATTGVRAAVTPVYLRGANAVVGGTEQTALAGTVTANAIAAGDLEINGVVIGGIAGAAAVNGLNMGKAFNAREAINQQATASGVHATLTTLSAGGAAAAGTLTTVSFNLNGVAVSFDTDATPADDTIDAINAVSSQTGVTAVLGDGTNGGVAGSVVLSNTLAGDETDIVISGYSGGLGTATTGLANVTQAVDATHNTGQVVFHSDAQFTLTSPNNPTDDLILDELGLGGGVLVTGISGDAVDDGILVYGSTPSVLTSGDLIINGVDIFDVPTAIMGEDVDNALVDAINAKSASTGISATRNGIGALILSAADGRNLHVETSGIGETVTRLNGGTPPVAQDRIYYGSVHLQSDRRFTLETTPTAGGYEPGLAAYSLSGGAAVSGEVTDVAGDGRIDAVTIRQQDGSVRYAGDRLGDLEIKVGGVTTLTVGKNGQDALAATGVFTGLKSFENALRAEKFREVTSGYAATSPAETISGGNSGLARADELNNGTFRITITDDLYNSTFITSIPVNGTYDSLEDVAARIDGVPYLTSYVDSNGYLQVATTDPTRFSLRMDDETGNFLQVMDIDVDRFQVKAIENSIADMDVLMDTLTKQISDFGAKSNRITIQTQIFDTLEVSSKESLSELQDTDVVKAIMDLRAKEFAYEAALNSASKVMQMSLVDFL
ncbi:MAG: hypothetical protein KKG47_00360 [Proteobacteria bacterium]|nr:hypothetical protein [Pseudomonadota bacterium]MBU1737190.1 hypothetical protein [Pseudomonadota bacterium]